MECKYCGKECKNKNSLVQHEIRCKDNPNKIQSNFTKYNEDVRSGLMKKENSNQFTKAENLGIQKPIVSEETRDKLRYWKGKRFPECGKEKIRNTVNGHIKNDKWHTRYRNRCVYNGVKFDSSWEVEFVKYLDNLNIEWIRPNEPFEYIWEESVHNYYPDLYLPQHKLYIEIKAIPSDRDYEKWRQFKYDLDIYDSLDLNNLGLSISIDRRNLIPEEFRHKHITLGLS